MFADPAQPPCWDSQCTFAELHRNSSTGLCTVKILKQKLLVRIDVPDAQRAHVNCSPSRDDRYEGSQLKRRRSTAMQRIQILNA